MHCVTCGHVLSLVLVQGPFHTISIWKSACFEKTYQLSLTHCIIELKACITKVNDNDT